MTYHKALPITKGIAETFWTSLKDRKFMIQSCTDCTKQIFYPRVVCPHCGGSHVEYAEHEGTGEIYSFSVTHRTRLPGFKDEVPYVLALVDIDGGGRMMTNIIDCDPNEVQIGAKVKIAFTDVTEEITLPHFKLA